MIYNLYAVSNHTGSTYGGHYTADCKHPDTGVWHHYNDSRYCIGCCLFNFIFYCLVTFVSYLELVRVCNLSMQTLVRIHQLFIHVFIGVVVLRKRRQILYENRRPTSCFMKWRMMNCNFSRFYLERNL